MILGTAWIINSSLQMQGTGLNAREVPSVLCFCVYMGIPPRQSVKSEDIVSGSCLISWSFIPFFLNLFRVQQFHLQFILGNNFPT